MSKFNVSKLLLLAISLQLTSCAWLSRKMKEGTMDEEEVVSKAQYDELMKKYVELEKKNNPSEVTPKTSPAEASQLVSDLEKAPQVKDEAKSTLMETVDVFDPNAVEKKMNEVSDASSAIDNLNLDSTKVSSIEDEISMLKKAMGEAGSGQYDVAIKSLQNLTKSTRTGQIKVRARFGTGEVLLAQKEYDLALQVYEDIITNYAYSGLVLNALKRAILCAEKLNLMDKKTQYESLVRDVFGT